MPTTDFWGIATTIEVVAGDRVYDYRVEPVDVVDVDDFDTIAPQAYARSGPKRLALMTCGPLRRILRWGISQRSRRVTHVTVDKGALSMPRIPDQDVDSVPPRSRDLLEAVGKRIGKILNVHSGMTHGPVTLATYAAIREAIAEYGTFNARTREG